MACNNSPNLCNKAYNEVTYLGAHDSPFVANSSNDYTESGNQYYNSTIQLSAGVRLLSAQVQLSRGPGGTELHVCHTDCNLLDAGTLSGWLGEVKSWMDSNPNEVVTILLVNGAAASASDLAVEYQKAGISSSLVYTPTGSTSGTQNWPSLQEMINTKTRMVNFVDYISDNSETPWLISEWTYVFENNYDLSWPSPDFSCEPNRPSNVAGNTAKAISAGLMPLMNHFFYREVGFGIQSPAVNRVSIANAPSNSTNSLGTAATQCTSFYGRAPSFILVDFFNEGPAIATIDRLNGVTNPVGRMTVSRGKPPATSAGFSVMVPKGWAVWLGCLTGLLGLAML